MKRLFVLMAISIAAVCSTAVYAAQDAGAPTPPPAPVAVGSTGGTVCDVWYLSESEIVGTANDAGRSFNHVPAIPMADVNDNHAKALVVLDAMSKEQDKGGPYSIIVQEFRRCDGGGIVEMKDGGMGALISGVTLAGGNRIARVGLQQASLIVARFEDRARKGAKTAWDHSRAKKVKRDDLGRRVND